MRKKKKENIEKKRKAYTLLKNLLGVSVPPGAESDFCSLKAESRGVMKNLIVVRAIIMLVA